MVICRKEQSPVKDLFLQIDVTERLFCHVISEEVRWIEKTQKARVKKRITQGNSIEHGNERGWYKTKKIKKKSEDQARKIIAWKKLIKSVQKGFGRLTGCLCQRMLG